MPAPTIATSTSRSSSRGRIGLSAASWAIHGDRFGWSAYATPRPESLATATRPTAATVAPARRRAEGSGAGVRLGQVPREQVLAPVVVELAPDGVDVVRAVLGVVVLDEEGRPAHDVVVAAAGGIGAGPGERDVAESCIDDPGPGRIGDLRSGAVHVVADQPLEQLLARATERRVA